MKKGLSIISGIAATLILSQALTNSAFAAGGAFSQYSFIYDLVDELTDYMKNNTDKVDIISVGDQLDLKVPENSKVKVIVGDEESAEKVEKYVCDLGYEKEILNIVIDSNFRPVPDGNAVCFGDLNSDQTIDVTDLTELSLALLGDKELTEDQQKAADIDGDGSVTLADLARLQQYLSKKIDEL